jgi:hypothetical protein
LLFNPAARLSTAVILFIRQVGINAGMAVWEFQTWSI